MTAVVMLVSPPAAGLVLVLLVSEAEGVDAGRVGVVLKLLQLLLLLAILVPGHVHVHAGRTRSVRDRQDRMVVVRDSWRSAHATMVLVVHAGRVRQVNLMALLLLLVHAWRT